VVLLVYVKITPSQGKVGTLYSGGRWINEYLLHTSCQTHTIRITVSISLLSVNNIVTKNIRRLLNWTCSI